MDIIASTSYHLAREDQQYGPYQGDDLYQMAQNGQVLATDQIWSEGMANWAPATSFTQLAPIFAAAQPGAVSTDTQNVQTSVDQGGTLRVARKGVTGPGIVKSNIRPGAGSVAARTGSARRPTSAAVYTGKAGANFAILGWSFAAFLIGLALVMVAGISMAATSPSMEGVPLEDFKAPAVSPALGALVIIGSFLYPIGLLVYGIFSLIYLHRAWSHLQILPEVRSTPGKAIGFLFIPFFNIYWQFVAYWGWAEDYNKLKQRAGLMRAPDVPSGLFLTFCILNLVVGPLLHPFVMFKLCQGVNFLAATPDEEIAGGGYA